MPLSSTQEKLIERSNRFRAGGNYVVSDPVSDPEGRLFVVGIVCYLLGYAHHLRLSFKENLLHHFLALMAQQVAAKDGHYLIACFLRVTMRSRIDAESLHA